MFPFPDACGDFLLVSLSPTSLFSPPISTSFGAPTIYSTWNPKRYTSAPHVKGRFIIWPSAVGSDLPTEPRSAYTLCRHAHRFLDFLLFLIFKLWLILFSPLLIFYSPLLYLLKFIYPSNPISYTTSSVKVFLLPLEGRWLLPHFIPTDFLLSLFFFSEHTYFLAMSSH